MKEKLIPPDPKRCQVETQYGGPFSFGPPTMIRCKKKPVVIAKEKKAPQGSMSMCLQHLIVFLNGDYPKTTFEEV